MPHLNAKGHNRTIEELDLSVGVYAALKRRGINFEYELLELSLQDLMAIRNMGRRRIQSLIENLVPSWTGSVFPFLQDESKSKLPLESLLTLLN